MAAQCATSAVLFGAGDLIAQQGIEKKGLKGHDVRRPSCIFSVVELANGCIALVGTDGTTDVLRGCLLRANDDQVVSAPQQDPVPQCHEGDRLSGTHSLTTRVFTSLIPILAMCRLSLTKVYLHPVSSRFSLRQ